MTAMPTQSLPLAPTDGPENGPESVSALNARVARLLRAEIGRVSVLGEISNLRLIARSGHRYFVLKDAGAAINCALFASNARRLGFEPGDGQQVVASGRVDLYQERGDYQLVVDRLEPAGAGALQQAFEALKRRLHAEGLFDRSGKPIPPRLPHRVGVITSPGTAALHDVLAVLRQRCPALPVIVYPAAVQGGEAPPQLRAALATAIARAEVDVLLLVRGGGSLEDLWAFNDEALTRAVATSPIPIITGVGHEIDVTLVDFAASLRAATPSAAAEQVAPDTAALLNRVGQQRQRLVMGWQQRQQRERQHLVALQRALTAHAPERTVERHQQTLDLLAERLLHGWNRQWRWQAARWQGLQARMEPLHPVPRLMRRRERLLELNERLRKGIGRALPSPRQRLTSLSQRLRQRPEIELVQSRQRLEALRQRLELANPRQILSRGYALVLDDAGQPLTSAHQARVGQGLALQLRDGQLGVQVTRA